MRLSKLSGKITSILGKKMQSEEFINLIKLTVRDSAVEGTVANLEEPPGRKPRQELKECSSFYHSLSDREKFLIKHIITDAVNQAVFGFLTVLDGDRIISKEDYQLEIYYKNDSGENLLNNPDGIGLHDIYNAVD